MQQYLVGKIDERTFCDEYYYSYGLEIDYETLLDVEQRAFAELSAVSRRFTEFQEDIEQYPGVYFTSRELHEKVKETQDKLRAESPI